MFGKFKTGNLLPADFRALPLVVLRGASYLRKVMTKHGMKIHAKSDSAIESAFP